MTTSRYERLFWPVLLGAAVFLWILPIRSAFWADETVTYWIVRGGAADLIRRCTIWPHSILYAAILWAFERIGGHSEAWLRLPSLAAMAVAAWLLYRLARELYDRETALSAATLFALTSFIAAAACDARPYAFAVAAAIASTLLLVRWFRRGGLAAGLLYAAAAALTLHFQVLFAYMLGVHALYALAAWRARPRPSWRQATPAAGLFLLLTFPLALQYSVGFRARHEHAFADPPRFAQLLALYLPLELAGALLALAASFLAGYAIRFRRLAVPPGGLVLPAAWSVLPVAAMLSGSLFGIHLLVPRYVLPYCAGYALLLGLALRGLEPAVVRRAALTTIAVLAVVLSLGTGRAFEHSRFSGDWKSALALADRESRRDGAPLLFHSQFAESDSADWRTLDPATSSVTAPIGYYPVAAPVVVLPRTFGPEVARFLSARLAAPGRVRALLVTHSGASRSGAYIDWFKQNGWRVSLLGNFDKVLLLELLR